MTRTTRRTFLGQSLLGGAAAASGLTGLSWAGSGMRASQDPIRIGVVGVRGRGRGHIGAFKQSPDAEVVAICDVDEGVIGPAMKSVPEARYFRDLRELLDDKSIDAISVATPNHWHSLATIWALQAGKHVYVEKPISHNIFEGRQVVKAAAKYGRIVQHGTQSRSSGATRDAIAWMHAGGLGKVHTARGLCYKRRESIGKVTGSQEPPKTADYNLWTGPAELVPLRRKSLHYDWHWDFLTGCGDLGNQGVHQVDIARWGLGKSGLPKHVRSYGGRVGYDDDGNTPNSMVSVYDYGDSQIIFEVRGLPTPDYKGAAIGVVFHGEKGYLVSASYEKLQAFDHEGQVIETFTGGGNHFQNFLDAIRADDSGLLNAPCLEGHISSSLCHLGNVSYRLGSSEVLAKTEAPFPNLPGGAEVFGGMCEHLITNGVDAKSAKIVAGVPLDFEPEAEQFTGDHAAEANRMLGRDYRAPFVVPAEV